MSSQWYLYKNGEQSGPYSREDFYRLAQSGAFGPADLVWTEGMEDWARADQIEFLFTAPPPPLAPFPEPPPSPAPAYQPRGQGGYQAAPTRKKGRGGLIALVILVILTLVGGSYLAVTNLLLNDTEEVAAVPGENGVEERAEEGTEGVFRTADVEGITDELAAVIEHMINQGINVTGVQVQVVGSAMYNPEAGVSVSTDKTFFEMFHYDLETADQKTLDFLNNISEEAYALNGNILMYKPDRFGDDEPEDYTEAVESIIAAFVSF